MTYQKQDWKDLPDESTPINAERLKHIENGIYDNSDEINMILKVIGLNNDTYDSTKTYFVGDSVIHNHMLYECTTAITIPEEFNITKWTEMTVLVEDE